MEEFDRELQKNISPEPSFFNRRKEAVLGTLTGIVLFSGFVVNLSRFVDNVYSQLNNIAVHIPHIPETPAVKACMEIVANICK